ncbi:MAG: hypothetical protein U9P07_05125 [Pseudomonadota bacterium]|nr:hypothetical protein [Pseudomonadota bacterium]MEA3240699.1 hypothetical protein [Pseudomonadota bacterium]
MTARIFVFLIVAEILVSGLLPVFPALAQEKTILDKKCTACHEVDIILEPRRPVSEWQEIVARMAEYAEGELSKVDQLMVLNYLKQHLAVKAVK